MYYFQYSFMAMKYKSHLYFQLKELQERICPSQSTNKLLQSTYQGHTTETGSACSVTEFMAM